MVISLNQAAGVLGKNSDEVMFLVQSGKLQAGVDEDTLAWTFNLEEVLTVKAKIDNEVNEETGSGPEFLIE